MGGGGNSPVAHVLQLMPRELTDEDVAIAQEKLMMAQWAKNFSQASQEERLNRARKAAKFFAGKRHSVLGEHVGSIPLSEYYRLKQKYGTAALSDKEFMGWMQRRVLKPNGLSYAN